MARYKHKGPQVDTPEYRAAWLARVWEKSIVTESGCVLWQGHMSEKGYGMTTYHSKSVAIHRMILSFKLGRPLAKGEFSCHKCDTPACWNEDHLWLGDALTNQQDKNAKRRNYFTNQTHCKHGHEFTPENTFRHESRPGVISRKCMTCQKIRNTSESNRQRARDYQRRMRAQAKAERGKHL